MIQVALLVAIASILFTLESLVQSPLPWMRLGLANIITLLALRWWGMKEAMAIVVLRVLLGSFLVGKFFHPVFLLSLSGGVMATLTMGTVMKMQLVLAYLIYIRHSHLFSLMPLFLLSSLIGGAVIGILAQFIDSKLKVSGVSV